jgi:hypothetical protein
VTSVPLVPEHRETVPEGRSFWQHRPVAWHVFERSEIVAAARFDAERSCVDVRLASGAVYRYFMVPASVFAAFVSADSPGTFFNQRLKAYRCEKVLPSERP